jgi:cell division control protein 7
MTSVLLSQHSSNPLELPSSDPSRQEYFQRVQKVTGTFDSCNDSDSVREFYKPEMQDYQNHLGKLFPRLKRKHKARIARVDEEMESDDTLLTIPKDIRDPYENTEDEDEAEDEDEEEDEDEDADADLDAHGETDEEMSIQLKSQEEREEIEEEIQELEDAVPKLAADYKIVDRLGTGTFSSVYKAMDLGYHKWNNAPWHGSHPPSSSAHYLSSRHPNDSKVFVAIKKIYPTSNPERIRNEISIMQDCRGCRHVSQLITAFRHEDQVVAIMPYHRNEDFRVGFIVPLPSCAGTDENTRYRISIGFSRWLA